VISLLSYLLIGSDEVGAEFAELNVMKQDPFVVDARNLDINVRVSIFSRAQWSSEEGIT
jgi:hypothetical protein